MHTIPRILAICSLCLAAIGMLCSCVQQLQEAREMDAKYEAYVKSKQTETPALTKLNYLEFLNAQGEVMPGKLFLQRNIGVCEKAEEYSRDYLFYDDDYMLPEADRARFLALPAITKALKH